MSKRDLTPQEAVMEAREIIGCGDNGYCSATSGYSDGTEGYLTGRAWQNYEVKYVANTEAPRKVYIIDGDSFHSCLAKLKREVSQ